MNILPKKRWHVRNRDNKERVRRDEENARLEENKEQSRIALAEQEARISLLRKKSNVGDSLTNDDAECQTLTRHINLFAREEEAGGNYRQDNIDYVKEKNAEKESYEKKIGLLTYVGQSSIEAKSGGNLWYTNEKKARKENEDSDSEKEGVKKSRLDPMAIVEKHMKHKKSQKDHKKKKKKEKHKSPPVSSSSKSIEKLREERLIREKIERERTKQLLNKGSQNVVEENFQNDRNRYFNQYNPDLARKKR